MSLWNYHSELISPCKACGEFGVDPSKRCEVKVKWLFSRSESTLGAED